MGDFKKTSSVNELFLLYNYNSAKGTPAKTPADKSGIIGKIEKQNNPSDELLANKYILKILNGLQNVYEKISGLAGFFYPNVENRTDLRIETHFNKKLNVFLNVMASLIYENELSLTNHNDDFTKNIAINLKNLENCLLGIFIENMNNTDITLEARIKNSCQEAALAVSNLKKEITAKLTVETAKKKCSCK